MSAAKITIVLNFDPYLAAMDAYERMPAEFRAPFAQGIADAHKEAREVSPAQRWRERKERRDSLTRERP